MYIFLFDRKLLQPFFRFSYVTGSSLTSPGEPPMREMYCTPITRKSQENETERGNSVNEWRVHKITHVGAELILLPFRRFTYVSSFSNPSFASRKPQLILQPFFRFSYVTGSSLTSPGEPPMVRMVTLFIVKRGK